ncbi:hypothetical protein PR202_gb17237 [Eleusine coracana subsp. coracana]|uniref:Potassium transporter n=1 Tax=Eleusine coracana subsp. coracana TaxID=191504 RepID=A0AAV5F2G4_ELECO|nr:hypothetical protein PR202_gb17237 [Eleusine coracana subsp. coracana]
MVNEQHQFGSVMFTDVLLPVTCVILVALFALQHYGTHRVGFLFAPIVCMWLLSISSIGVYNIVRWNPQVYKALSPYYMYRFLQKTRTGGWLSLGGVLLCVTGSEAMYADLGHFSHSSIAIAFTMVVYPSLILAYMGQAAYISQHHSFESNNHIGFYVSVPGLAVITVMIVTTCFMSLVIVLCWNKNIVFALSFLLFFGAIEAVYFSATLVKFHEGAWVLITLSLIFLMVMCVWHYGSTKRYEFDVENKILVFLCVKSVSVPHVEPEERFLVGRIGLKQYRLYRVVVRYGYRDVQQDALEFEKDLISSIAEFIRSGDSDKNGHPEGADSPYEMLSIVSKGLPFQEEDAGLDASSESSVHKETELSSKSKRVRFVFPENAQVDTEVRAELHELTEAREAGMSFIMGRSHMKAKSGSNLIKRITINIIYEFLMRNSRGPAYAANVPHVSTIEVGMVCQV